MSKIVSYAIVLAIPVCVIAWSPARLPAQPAQPAKNVEVTEVRVAEFEKALAGYKGKVVVVDSWATWCAPCVKKFPHLVELHNTFADKGLVCVSLSMDKLSNVKNYKKQTVLEFLKDKKATFPNFIAALPKTEEDEWVKLLGECTALPYMVVFSRTGKNVWNSDDGPKLTEEELAKLIEDQLK